MNATGAPGSLEAQRDALFAGQGERMQQAQQFYASQPQAPVAQSAMRGFNQPNPARSAADAIIAQPHYLPESSGGPLLQRGPHVPGSFQGQAMIPARQVDQGVWGPGGRQYGINAPMPGIPMSGQRLNSAANVGLTPAQKLEGLTRPGAVGNFRPNPSNGAVGAAGGQYTAPSGNVLNVSTRTPGVVRVAGTNQSPEPTGDQLQRQQVARLRRQQTKDFRTLSRARLNNLDPRAAPAVFAAAQRQGIMLPGMAASAGLANRVAGMAAPGAGMGPNAVYDAQRQSQALGGGEPTMADWWMGRSPGGGFGAAPVGPTSPAAPAPAAPPPAYAPPETLGGAFSEFWHGRPGNPPRPTRIGRYR